MKWKFISVVRVLSALFCNSFSGQRRMRQMKKSSNKKRIGIKKKLIRKHPRGFSFVIFCQFSFQVISFYFTFVRFLFFAVFFLIFLVIFIFVYVVVPFWRLLMRITDQEEGQFMRAMNVQEEKRSQNTIRKYHVVHTNYH